MSNITYSSVSERDHLLSDDGKAVELKEWETDEIQSLKESNPEQYERTKQYLLYMKQFEGLLKRKVQQSPKLDTLDLELLICIYNLFLTLCT